ncbi:MAG TPA: hypothetical protein VGI40_06890 [Pirellulaceae bacterium]|jgi:hypothetical protein
MLSGTANISRGWPAIHVLKLASDQKINTKSPSESSSDDVVLSAVEHPPRIGETRPIAALLPEVLARYGLNRADSQTSIDVSV